MLKIERLSSPPKELSKHVDNYKIHEIIVVGYICVSLPLTWPGLEVREVGRREISLNRTGSRLTVHDRGYGIRTLLMTTTSSLSNHYEEISER